MGVSRRFVARPDEFLLLVLFLFSSQLHPSIYCIVGLKYSVPAIIRKCRNCCRNCRNRNRTRRPRTRIDARQQAFELALERMLYATGTYVCRVRMEFGVKGTFTVVFVTF